MFFRDFIVDYFKIKYDNKNVYEDENRSSYTLILNNITQLNSDDTIYNEFLSKYITQLSCNIEFKAVFQDDEDGDEEEYLDLTDDETLKNVNTIGLKVLVLKIDKSKNKSIIFDTSSFEKCLNSLQLKDILNYFSKHNNLFVFDLEEEINNGYYFINRFSSNEQPIDNLEQTTKKINERNRFSFFYNASEYDFIPDSFYFKEINNKHLDDVFKLLLFISSIVFISDYSFFKDNEFCFKIKDKKFLLNSYQQFISLLNENSDISDNYYLIYDWIYNDAIYNNISDKFEIAVHTIDKCNTSNEIYIEKRIFEIIKSSFTLYLKENVDKYLLFKQKIIENITSSIKECYTIINNVKKAHMQFLLSIFTVLFTLIIGETITKTQTKILSDEVSIILYILIFIIVLLCYYRQKDAIKNINIIFKISSDLKEKINKDLNIEDDTFEIFNEKDVLEELEQQQNIFYYIIIFISVAIFILNRFF